MMRNFFKILYLVDGFFPKNMNKCCDHMMILSCHNCSVSWKYLLYSTKYRVRPFLNKQMTKYWNIYWIQNVFWLNFKAILYLHCNCSTARLSLIPIFPRLAEISVILYTSFPCFCLVMVFFMLLPRFDDVLHENLGLCGFP